MLTICVESSATSASRMRLSLAVRFSTATPRLLTVCSRRFWAAPRSERRVLRVVMAAIDLVDERLGGRVGGDDGGGGGPVDAAAGEEVEAGGLGGADVVEGDVHDVVGRGVGADLEGGSAGSRDDDGVVARPP
nr:hypothetical protein [Tepidiforma sp.]